MQLYRGESTKIDNLIDCQFPCSDFSNGVYFFDWRCLSGLLGEGKKNQKFLQVLADFVHYSQAAHNKPKGVSSDHLHIFVVLLKSCS